MASAVEPDKLAIASFVYQLHSYFNENIPSAVSLHGANKTIPPLPQKGMAEFDKITMSKLDSDSSVVGVPSSDRLRKYSRHMVENNYNNDSTDNTATAATTDETVKELFPLVEPTSMNVIVEVVNDEVEEPAIDKNELFPRIDGKSKETETQQNKPTTEDVPNVVVNSPKDVPPNNSLLAKIHAKSSDNQRTIEDSMADQVVVLNPPEDQPPQPILNNDIIADSQAVINLDNTVNEISVSR